MASVTTDKRTGNKVVRAYAGVNPRTHKPHNVSETLPANATEEEIEAAKARMDKLAAITKGNPHGLTIETLVYYYLDNQALHGMAETTLDSYHSYTRRHVVPRIGATLFKDATAITFSTFYHDLARPKEQGGAGLKQSTIKKIHSFLSGCFSTLKREGVIENNPIAEMKVEPGDEPEMKPLSQDDFAKLLIYLEGVITKPVTCKEDFEEFALANVFWTDSQTGFRRGELSGFLKRHRVETYIIDDETGERITVPAMQVIQVLYRGKKKRDGKKLKKKAPKSESSIRVVSIDPKTDSYLDAYEEIQEEILFEQGIIATPDMPLFSHADGKPFAPDKLTDAFKEIVKKLGLDPEAHLHTLRHTHGTYLLDQGESIRDVQERLGHEDISTTQKYTKTVEGKDFAAAKRFAKNTETMMQRQCNEKTARYIPTCPRTGETCCRFDDSFLEK